MARAKHNGNRETEVKLRISDLGALLRKLKAARARPSKSVFERNTLFDTSARDFTRRGAILRIRTEVAASPPGSRRRVPSGRRKPLKGLLTYKEPPHTSTKPRLRYKIRDEIEHRLPNAIRLERLFLRLGLAPWFSYEKFRTPYRLPSLPGVHLDLDETPIGVFLELEGSESAIDRAAQLLDFHPRDYITVSYLELYLAECRQRRRKPGHMLFPAKKSSR